MPSAASTLIQNLLVLLRPIFFVLSLVPIQKVLIGAKEERTGPACRIDDFQLRGFLYASALKKLGNGLADDVINDIRGSVIDSTGSLDLWFVFNLGLVPCG